MHRVQALTVAKRPGRNHSPAFKAEMAFAAIKCDKTRVELSEQFDVYANQITQRKNQLLERASDALDGNRSKEPPIDAKTLHARIGELTLENDLLKVALTKAGLLSAGK